MSVTPLQLEADSCAGVMVEPAEACGVVLVLGGSEGGTPEFWARQLAAAGLVTLGLAYFGLPGLPSKLVEVPLEYVERALLRLARHPAARGRPVSVLGGSKGAELALVLGTSFPDLVGKVVAAAPSSVVWMGINPEDFTAPARSSWSRQGRPLAFVPPVQVVPEFSPAGVAVRPVYEASLAAYPDDGEAWIPVEEARGPVLVISGGNDQLSPSQPMAEQLVARMARNGRGADIEHLCYLEAGHLAGMPGTGRALPHGWPSGLPPLDLGGTPEADQASALDAWPKIVNFLTNL